MPHVPAMSEDLPARESNPETGLYYYRARYYDPTAGRFLSEDPIAFGGGNNFYPYTNNSPTNGGDPSGLWSPAAHRQMIWNALHPCGVSNADIWRIQQGSQFIDDNFQGHQWSYMHSMRDGTAKQGPADAQRARDGFISSEMHDASSVYAASGVDQAMFLFGMAMHPVMDSSSPAHTDAQGNPIPWCGMTGCGGLSGLDQVNQHSAYDVIGIERLQDLNAHPEIQKRMNIKIRNLFQSLTGKKLNCECD